MLRIAAIVIAILGMFLAAMYLRFSGDGADHNRTVPVVVAAKDIPAGTEIKERMVKVVEFPVSEVVSGAHGDTRAVVGRVARVALVTGDQVGASKVSVLPVLGASIAFIGGGGGGPGSRALSLNTEPVTIEGERVYPGDQVDIVIELDGWSTTLVKGARVLAVGQGTITVTFRAAIAPALAEALNSDGKIRLSGPA